MSNLKEKIHHLDDMLKSQQRKVRQMIEQVIAKDSGTADCQKVHRLLRILRSGKLISLCHFVSSAPEFPNGHAGKGLADSGAAGESVMAAGGGESCVSSKGLTCY